MPKRYPPEQRERAVKMVLDHLDVYRSLYAACQAIGPKLGIGPESGCMPALLLPEGQCSSLFPWRWSSTMWSGGAGTRSGRPSCGRAALLGSPLAPLLGG